MFGLVLESKINLISNLKKLYQLLSFDQIQLMKSSIEFIKPIEHQL